MKHSVSSSKTETPYVHQHVADYKWGRLGRKVRAVAARSGVRAAIEYWSAHQFDFAAEYRESIGLDAARTCAKAIAAVVAKNHAGATTSAIFDMATRKRASIFARREVWFRLHVLQIGDKEIAGVWKCDVATVKAARAWSIRTFPVQTAQIEQRALEDSAKAAAVLNPDSQSDVAEPARKAA